MRKTGRVSTTVKAVARAVEVLRVLSTNVNRVSDISRRLNFSNSTTHRLLKTLEEAGLVVQDPLNNQYYLGHLLVRLASNPTTAHQHLIACAYQEMRYLREISEETITLHIRLGTQRIRLQELAGTHDVRYIGRPTMADPLWAGAMGKVLLAQLEEDELEVILKNIDFIPLTPHTITDKEVFRKEIGKVKKQGYATSYGETVSGVSAISVPVSDYIEPVALSIVGPAYRFESKMVDFVNELKESASRISKNLLEIQTYERNKI